MRQKYLAAVVVGLACWLVGGASIVSADDWPGFRGPLGNGLSTEKVAPLEWSNEKNVKWKVALPKPSNGSPIVSRGNVFLVGCEEV